MAAEVLVKISAENICSESVENTECASSDNTNSYNIMHKYYVNQFWKARNNESVRITILSIMTIQ